jgi:MFS family permease
MARGGLPDEHRGCGMSLMTADRPAASAQVMLGLRQNLAQFTLLVIVNAFVGAMVGLERAILPAIAEQDFHLLARAAILSFIVVFGVTKALTNYFAGRFSDALGRKGVLVAGWCVAVPVPFMLMWAPSWNFVLLANVLLGVSQGLTWSTTVIMKIDLTGPERRGLAMGLNEFAGYMAVAGSALATGHIAALYGLRPQPFYLGVVYVAAGLVLSVALVRDTRAHVIAEAAGEGVSPTGEAISQRDVFLRTSLSDRELSSVSQAGLVNSQLARFSGRRVSTVARSRLRDWGAARRCNGRCAGPTRGHLAGRGDHIRLGNDRRSAYA